MDWSQSWSGLSSHFPQAAGWQWDRPDHWRNTTSLGLWDQEDKFRDPIPPYSHGNIVQIRVYKRIGIFYSSFVRSFSIFFCACLAFPCFSLLLCFSVLVLLFLASHCFSAFPSFLCLCFFSLLLCESSFFPCRFSWLAFFLSRLFVA